MTTDFEGEMMDVDKDEGEGSESEGDDGDEPEHNMDETEGENDEVVDERLLFFAHPPISPICRTPLFPYLTFSFFRSDRSAAGARARA